MSRALTVHYRDLKRALYICYSEKCMSCECSDRLGLTHRIYVTVVMGHDNRRRKCIVDYALRVPIMGCFLGNK